MDLETWLLPIITGVVAGLTSAILTYLGTRSKIRLELTAAYDKELREKRLKVYTILWMKLKSLARFSRQGPLTYHSVKDTSEKMRNWYFDSGGIYLSKQSRRPYFDLKKTMQKIIDDEYLEEHPNKRIPKKITDTLLKRGTILRNSLADDIGTRRGPYI